MTENKSRFFGNETKRNVIKSEIFLLYFSKGKKNRKKKRVFYERKIVAFGVTENDMKKYYLRVNIF